MEKLFFILTVFLMSSQSSFATVRDYSEERSVETLVSEGSIDKELLREEKYLVKTEDFENEFFGEDKNVIMLVCLWSGDGSGYCGNDTEMRQQY